MRLNSVISIRLLQSLGLLTLVLSGCAYQGASSRDLTIDAPAEFSDSGDSVTPDYWWTSFEDPNLNAQIFDALQNNFNLSAALQRVNAVRAIARREASDLFPDLNGVLGINSNFGSGENSAIYQLGLSTSYQVDLWGEIGSRVDAQWLRAHATSANYQTIALTLSADITVTWLALIEARAQVELLKVQIETNQTGLKLQEERFGLGLIRSADVLRQRQLLESTYEQVVIAESRIEILEHQLAVLRGEMPQSASYPTGSRLPDLPELPSTGLPSELIRRRPDVRRDFLAVQAADRDLASAISSQYPRLNLTGSILNVADNSDTLLQDWFLSIGSQLIAPLLDGGQRRAEVDRTCAVREELFNGYSQTVLNAFREVEDSLAQEKYQRERIQRLENQVKLAGQASDQLREQYLIGDAEYLDVLSAITGQQRLQRQLLSAQLELRLIRVSLYLALAGGFEIPENLDAQTVSRAVEINTALVPEPEQPERPTLEPAKTNILEPLEPIDAPEPINQKNILDSMDLNLND